MTGKCSQSYTIILSSNRAFLAKLSPNAQTFSFSSASLSPLLQTSYFSQNSFLVLAFSGFPSFLVLSAVFLLVSLLKPQAYTQLFFTHLLVTGTPLTPMQQDELSFSYDLGISPTTFKPKAAVKALTVAEIKKHLY